MRNAALILCTVLGFAVGAGAAWVAPQLKIVVRERGASDPRCPVTNPSTGERCVSYVGHRAHGVPHVVPNSDGGGPY